MAPKSDPKLDLILEQLKALDQLGPMSTKIDDLHNSLGTLREEVSSISFTVGTHKDRITALERDMSSQKEISNTQQQQLRLLTLRLLNVPASVGEATNNYAGLRDTIYTRFLLPLLHSAVAKKDIPEVPTSSVVIESCFRPYLPSPGKQPPPVIIKLASRLFKVALMKNKRDLPSPSSSETDSGITRFILIEDLTPDTHRCLASLSKSTLTSKVWSVDGRIKFIKADKPNVIITVKSVYDPIVKILSG